MKLRRSFPITALLSTSVLFVLATAATIRAELDAAKLRAIPGSIQRFVDDQTIAGAVTLVAHGGKVVSLDAVGLADRETSRPMRPDTLFWIASMSKPLAATAVLMLQDEGKLTVDDPVERHLPEFKNQWLIEARTNDSMTLKRPPRAITIRDLLTHTSGIGDMPSPRWNSSLAEVVVGYPNNRSSFHREAVGLTVMRALILSGASSKSSRACRMPNSCKRA